jgi:hypothetical protein
LEHWLLLFGRDYRFGYFVATLRQFIEISVGALSRTFSPLLRWFVVSIFAMILYGFVELLTKWAA